MMNSVSEGTVTVARQPCSEQSNSFVISRCQRNNEVVINNNDNNDSGDESDVEEKLMAVYCRAGKLGAATYTVQTGELFLLDEIVDRGPEFLMFCNLYRQVSPGRVVLDGRGQGAFVSRVKKVVFSDSDEGSCKLVFLSSKEYSFEACKRRIYSLSLPTEPKDCTETERTLFLRTAVDFNQTQSVHALGALLRYLDLNWSNLNLDLQSKPQFLSLRRISLKDIVTIDEDSYRGLQIFTTVSHPSNFKKGVQGSNKEGLSLYLLFNKCSSKVGQKMMRVLMQHPTTDLQVLKRRQDAVEFFMKPQNDSLIRNMCSSLRFIKNVNGILKKIKELSAKPYQWKSLYNTLYNAVLICEMCEQAAGASEFLEQLATFDNNKLYEMALYMNRIIDFDLSKSERKFTVKAGVDSELDMKKQTMASLHGLMSETAKVELERLPHFIEECTMLYMPHLGYLLGVKSWADNMTMEQKQLPDMKFMFQNNDYIHYKSKGCEELDVMIGDTYPEIVAHETRIMMRLTAVILDNLHTLAACVDACAELDCLIAFSKVSKELNFVRPTMTSDKVISISQGRHPLHIMTCDNFVPNDAESSADDGCVMILTGPNSSGKSVYMKQIGLIVYLAHIGSFVPAQRATVGVTRHIHTRIQSAECVAAHMSAFLIDLRQMELALQECTSNSLIIIDEFSKGTSEVDGLSLLAACLNTMLFQGDQCPHMELALQECTSNSLIIIDEFGKGTSEVDGLSLLAACLNTMLFQGDQCPHMELALQESTSNSLIIIDEFGKGTSEVDGLSLLAACLNTMLFQGGQCPHMELALQECTSNSLIIIDEFGKGTSEVDGLSLLAACLNTMLFQGDQCPHVLLSTHFLNVKEYIVNTPLVKFLRFEHVMDGEAPVFLFRVTTGSVDSSFALQVARGSGIDSAVLDRAAIVADSVKNNTLPPPNKKILAKLKAYTEIIKTDLLAEDI